jgi:MFS family permease
MTRRRILALLATAELLGMSAWFSASALAPQLSELWHLSESEAGWLTTVVQLGFVVGTAAAAALNLADIIPSRFYFAGAAVLAGTVNAALLVAPSYPAALVLRFATGVCFAGVYPPAMKMIATWFKDGRGLAIGTIVGALTVGKATPYLVHGLREVGVAPVVVVSSGGAFAAALLVALFYRDGPHAFERRPFSWGLVGIVARSREVRLATGGYLGHMWELYAMWTWLATFLAMSFAARGQAAGGGPSVLAFIAIAAGGVGCVWGGWLADRIGREKLAARAMWVSGACALAVGACFGGPAWLLAAVAIVWGVSVVADSAQFSALVTELAPPHAVGTALTLQTSLGFLLTMASIQLVPHVAGWIGWRWAFAVLAIGPVLGIHYIGRLRRLRGR